MMRQKLTLAALLLITGFMAKAQISNLEQNTHDIGIQVNPLVSQILNFGNQQPVNNPFLLKYAHRFAGKSQGIGIGLGFARNTSDVDNGANSSVMDLDFRAGYEWYFPLGEKVELSLGPDVVFNGTSVNTVSVQVFTSGAGMDSTVSTTKSQVVGYGLGGRANITFKITPKLLIGTEATYYWIARQTESNTKLESWQENNFTNTTEYNYDSEDSESEQTDFSLNLPVALFLVFRL